MQAQHKPGLLCPVDLYVAMLAVPPIDLRLSSCPFQICQLADQLLSTYVELHGSALSLLVQQSMAAKDWQSLPAPSVPQPVCDQLLQRLARAEAEVGRLLDSTGRQQGMHQVWVTVGAKCLGHLAPQTT